jgi:hypothetical protein
MGLPFNKLYKYLGGFNPLSWFAKGEQGAWYDPSDLTTLFQDSTGVTPMAAVGTVADQPVGLMLDKSKGLALGAELVTNGDFSNGTTGWTLDTSWTISGGTANASSVGIGTGCYQPISGAINTWYKLTITVSNYVSGSVAVTLFSGDNGPLISANGVYTCYIQKRTLSPNYAGAACFSSAFTGSIDNISVRQIAGNHAFANPAAPANRPILSARVNLLTKTEDFSDAVWTKTGAGTGSIAVLTNNYGIAPDGTQTAARLQLNLGATPATAMSRLFQGGYGTAAQNTNSIYIKTTDGTTKTIYMVYTSTVTLFTVGPSWSLLQPPTTANAAYGQMQIGLDGSADTSTTADLLIWHPDVRPTNSGALLPPYQRVNTASDYDSVGFPLYLKCNGLQSAMSTNSIDFTATDKMTVVTGVRKLSDASGLAMVMELSVAVGPNARSFFLSAPRDIGNYGIYTMGTSGVDVKTPSYSSTPPITNILTTESSISTPIATIRVNSSQVGTSSNTQGTGNLGNYPLYLFARNNSSYFLNGQFYGAIIRGAQSDTASVVQTEQYMATKTGITF